MTPETILSPSYDIDQENDEYNIEEYNKKLRGVVHLNPEDGIYYTVRKVFERGGLALVEGLPWPESSNSRLEVVHLRDVLGMVHLEEATEEAGADIQNSGEAAQGNNGTPLPSNPSQVSAGDAPKPESRTNAEHASTKTDSPVRNGSNVSTVPGGVGHHRRLVSSGDDYPCNDRVNGGTKRSFPSGQVDSSVHEPQRRRSAWLRRENIPRAYLLSSETFLEAQAQRIVDWSLSKNYSLTPHLIEPTIFSLSADEEPSSHEVERHPRRHEWILGEMKEVESVNEAGCLKVVNRSEVPPGRKVLRLRWIYKIKRNDKGEAVLYKCRVVVMGNEAK